MEEASHLQSRRFWNDSHWISYYEGDGVEQSYEDAEEYFLDAVNSANSDEESKITDEKLAIAYYYLGEINFGGLGELPHKKAYQYFVISERLGNEDALKRLASPKFEKFRKK